MSVAAIMEPRRRRGCGQLPHEVDGVEHADIDADPGSRELVSRVPGQQDPAVTVSLRLPGLEPVARQPGHFRQGKIHAEHEADAVLEFGQGHRLVVVRPGGIFHGGLDERGSPGEPPVREHAAVGPGVTSTDPAQPGDIKVAVVEPGHRIRQGSLAKPVDLRVRSTGEGDAGRLADPAAGSVTARQEPGGQLVRAVRAEHVRRHRGIVLADPRHGVAVADIGPEFAGAVGEQALEPRLRERHCP
jgi:hypothetical protein